MSLQGRSAAKPGGWRHGGPHSGQHRRRVAALSGGRHCRPPVCLGLEQGAHLIRRMIRQRRSGVKRDEGASTVAANAHLPEGDESPEGSGETLCALADVSFNLGLWSRDAPARAPSRVRPVVSESYTSLADARPLSLQFGQLGVGRGEDRPLPIAVSALADEPVGQASCGWRHTTIVTVGGQVYTWGRGCCGQLGHGDLEDLCVAAADLLSSNPSQFSTSSATKRGSAHLPRDCAPRCHHPMHPRGRECGPYDVAAICDAWSTCAFPFRAYHRYWHNKSCMQPA